MHPANAPCASLRDRDISQRLDEVPAHLGQCLFKFTVVLGLYMLVESLLLLESDLVDYDSDGAVHAVAEDLLPLVCQCSRRLDKQRLIRQLLERCNEDWIRLLLSGLDCGLELILSVLRQCHPGKCSLEHIPVASETPADVGLFTALENLLSDNCLLLKRQIGVIPKNVDGSKEVRLVVLEPDHLADIVELDSVEFLLQDGRAIGIQATPLKPRR